MKFQLYPRVSGKMTQQFPHRWIERGKSYSYELLRHRTFIRGGVGGIRWDMLIVPGMSTFEKTENQETPNILYENIFKMRFTVSFNVCRSSCRLANIYKVPQPMRLPDVLSVSNDVSLLVHFVNIKSL